MLLWTGPSLSRAEPRGADSLGSVRHSEGTGGLVRCFYGTARESGVSFVRELHQSHKKIFCLSVFVLRKKQMWVFIGYKGKTIIIIMYVTNLAKAF